jgi:hypothetical protein
VEVKVEVRSDYDVLGRLPLFPYFSTTHFYPSLSLFITIDQYKMSQAIHFKLNDGKQIPALAWG